MFSIRFSSFQISSPRKPKMGSKNLLVEVTVNSKEEKIFVPNTSKNLGLGSLKCVLQVNTGNMCLQELKSIYSNFSMMYKNLYQGYGKQFIEYEGKGASNTRMKCDGDLLYITGEGNRKMEMEKENYMLILFTYFMLFGQVS